MAEEILGHSYFVRSVWIFVSVAFPICLAFQLFYFRITDIYLIFSSLQNL